MQLQGFSVEPMVNLSGSRSTYLQVCCIYRIMHLSLPRPPPQEARVGSTEAPPLNLGEIPSSHTPSSILPKMTWPPFLWKQSPRCGEILDQIATNAPNPIPCFGRGEEGFDNDRRIMNLNPSLWWSMFTLVLADQNLLIYILVILAPSPPTNIAITSITSTSALLRWSPPTSPNGLILLYSISISITNDLTSMRLLNSTIAGQALLVDSLQPFTEYSVVLYASNSIMGELSETMQFTTLEDGK